VNVACKTASCLCEFADDLVDCGAQRVLLFLATWDLPSQVGFQLQVLPVCTMLYDMTIYRDTA